MIRIIFAAMSIAVVAAVPATALEKQDTANTLTHGMAQMTLKIGQTSQYEVLETFGGPNITTLDGDGREVWIYDRFATVTASKDSGFSIGMALGSGSGSTAGIGGLGFGSKKSKRSTSSRSMILILKFGPDKTLVDFKSRSSSY